MSYSSLLMIFFYTAGALAVLVLAVLLYHLANRIAGRRGPSAAMSDNPRQDLTYMTILFQTMRDLTDKQKELARQLNATLDKKIGMVRQTVAKALEKHEKLRQAQRELTTLLEETKSDLASLQRQLGFIDRDRVKAAARSASEQAPAQESRNRPAVPGGGAADRFEAIATLEEEASSEEVVEDWVGLDLGTNEEDPFPIPEKLPETAEDPETAREAFRALLDMEPKTAANKPKDAGRENEVAGAEDRDRMSPLQARVYEYTDAGMSVPEIARELGVGKGEVRLILSLRKDKEG